MQEPNNEEKKFQHQGQKRSTTTKIRTASSVTALYLAITIVVSSVSSMHPDAMNSYYVYASAQLKIQLQQKNTDLSLSTLTREGSPLLGNPAALVTIIDFSDFQCYLCARYVKATEPLINETYIQSGKVALVFKHLPNRGFDSMGAALAAQCTNDQGKFWEYHELLFHSQQTIDSGWVSKDNLKKFASQIPSMDMKQFEECLNSEKYKSFI